MNVATIRVRRTVLAISVASMLTISGSGEAGDESAHTAATKAAAERFLVEHPEYSQGVGAPNMGPAWFQIPTDGDFLLGPRDGKNGTAINEPDTWQCLDPRQPPRLRQMNEDLGIFQAQIANLLGQFDCSAALACNYSHFSSNPSSLGIPSASDSAAVTLAWAFDITSAIEAAVRTGTPDPMWRCDAATWDVYWRRVLAAAHFTQDGASENHAVGNSVCGPFDPAMALLAPVGIVPSFDSINRCRGWIQQALDELRTSNPDQPDQSLLTCDQSFTRPPVLLEGASVTASFEAGVILPCRVGLSFACMGAERTFRHHCNLGAHSLVCSGPMTDRVDHAGGVCMAAANPPRSYCEGEPCSGGGEDYVTKAVLATLPLMQSGALAWAGVCRQPDIPCDPNQCTTWCRAQAATPSDSQGSCVRTQCDLPPTCACGEQHACEPRDGGIKDASPDAGEDANVVRDAAPPAPDAGPSADAAASMCPDATACPDPAHPGAYVCVDTATDRQNCGRCGHSCFNSTYSNIPTCGGGACGVPWTPICVHADSFWGAQNAFYTVRLDGTTIYSGLPGHPHTAQVCTPPGGTIGHCFNARSVCSDEMTIFAGTHAIEVDVAPPPGQTWVGSVNLIVDASFVTTCTNYNTCEYGVRSNTSVTPSGILANAPGTYAFTLQVSFP